MKTHPTQSPASCLFRIEGNFCFREKVKSQSSLSSALLTLAKSTLDICASTALDKIRIYAVHAHVCQEFVTIGITCLHTSIFFYAPRTYLSTYFTYNIYSLVMSCCIVLHGSDCSTGMTLLHRPTCDKPTSVDLPQLLPCAGFLRLEKRFHALALQSDLRCPGLRMV